MPEPPVVPLRPSPLARLARERDSLRGVIASIGRETDLAPLLARVLEHACALLAADHGAISLVDESRGTVRAAAVRDMPAVRIGDIIPPGVGMVGLVLERRAPVCVRRYAEIPTPIVPALDEHAMIGVPVHWGDAPMGVFALGRAPDASTGRRRPFGARDVETLEEFARHAAIAVHNARRLAAERLRGERLALIAHVGRLVTGDLQRDELLQRAADAIHEILGYENVAIALLLPEDPDTLLLHSLGGGYKRAIGGRHHIPIDRGLMGAAARTREVVLANEAASDPRYLPTPGTDGRQAEVVLPLLAGDRVLGVLNVERREPFAAEDVDGLRIVADQLAVALENAQLYEAAQRAAALEERHRLARELHDSVTQQLFTASLVAQSVGAAYARDMVEGERRASMLVDITRGALAEMRALLTELRPSAEWPVLTIPDAGLARLRGVGLVEAVRTHVASGAVGEVAVDVVDDGWTPQPPAIEETLYRIAREALHNVVKHAHAARAEVRATTRGGVARLTVHDDGAGFDPGTRIGGRRDGGLGLRSMRERAAERGGALHVESAPGRGTTVEAALPLGEADMP
ncbi:GAF domain protein (plasmid) [Gemmatirosa kalamazoonensis]|uniref:Oxygen sensor histidine kinase NreB n=1 Tax=Gemmatirosa kalamazoonensis TaxID=861299 RepID=W0RPU2_9BACT|nr:GAF domain-containing sensor histidine kinase [Gemmatirosa kalamazoonensis]AHG92512.1 GAF domain protein [Gemmatirosa kalamazoonensis]